MSLPSLSKFAGKQVLITGGSKGIGLGLVHKFLGSQSSVVATSREPAGAVELNKLAQEFSKDRLQVRQLDTSSPASIKDFVAGLKSGGMQHVDVLVNSAGVYGRRLGLTELEPEDFMTTFQTNAVGPFLVVQQLVLADLIGSQHPQASPQQQLETSTLIANISSIVASHGDQTVSSKLGGAYAYRASKAALNIINKGLCNDLTDTHRIESVLLHPGYVRTHMTGGQGAIDVEQSVSGLFEVLSSSRPLNNRFISFTGEEVPW